MDDRRKNALASLLDVNSIEYINSTENYTENQITSLLTHKKIPDSPWPDSQIKYLLYKLSNYDCNNYHDMIGMGEREGRVYSKLIADRHFNFTHGIGRSGNIYENQPKAYGSSILNRLATNLALHAIHLAGAPKAKSCVVLPVATGMALTLSLLTLKSLKPTAKYVIWSRIDQKSCFKSILTAGLQPLIVQNIINDYSIETNIDQIAQFINNHNDSEILCVMSTTSCFAPRSPDKIVEISKLCQQSEIFHLVNNAYGLQDSKIMHELNMACSKYADGVTFIVQSTDKNFMVPVGGSIVTSPKKQMIQQLCSLYPGRASLSPILDLIVTLLSMGKSGYLELLSKRKENFNYLNNQLEQLQTQSLIKLLVNRTNKISMCFTIVLNNNRNQNINQTLGPKLFFKHISGCRSLYNCKTVQIGNYSFTNFGKHHDDYKYDYLTVASAIGQKIDEIDKFTSKLVKLLSSLEFDQNQ